MSRWRLACDRCAAEGWIGPRPSPAGGRDAWCEGCQSSHLVPRGAGAPDTCLHCGTALTFGSPRFEELLGEAQNVAAVLSAWCGDPVPLGSLLPDRPRLLTDLDPPEPRDDDPPVARSGLEALARGQFARARSSLARAAKRRDARGHVWRALGIAAQRSGDGALAESSFARAIEIDPRDSAARLDRGALRAAQGDLAGAREDFLLAGDRREARWNRAAVALIEAVAAAPGLPAAGRIQKAREEAGEPSPYWSDHTVGRLLWTLLLERALAGGARGRGPSRPGAGARSPRGTSPEAAAAEHAETMRAAARELEFDTFWDRALVVHGLARLGLRQDAGAAAAALAAKLVRALREEPCARGPAGAWLTRPLASAAAAIAEARPGDALAALRAIVERDDVRRYRVPCHACGKGSIGVDRIEEEESEAD